MFQIIKKDKRIMDYLLEEEAPQKIASGYFWSEGPIWNEQEKALYFTDFRPNLIYRWTDDSGAVIWRKDTHSACGLAFGQNGNILCAESVSRSITSVDQEGEVTVLADSWKGKLLNSPNDVIVKGDGAVYFTDPYAPDLKLSKLIKENGIYRLSRAGGLQMVADLAHPNGLAFSPGEKYLYVDDTKLQQIWRYEVKPDGTLEPGKLFFQMNDQAGPGGADGMKLAEDGTLFVTGPGGIWVIDPDGRELGRIHFPEIAANLCFGGKDRRTLFVTAQSGVYRLKMKTAGLRDSSQLF